MSRCFHTRKSSRESRSEKKGDSAEHHEVRDRSSQEMEELMRAQDWGMDEFSRQELRESQCAVTQLTAQIQELQDKANNMNDSREFQDVEAVCSSRLSHVPVQPPFGWSPCGNSSRDQCQRPDTRNIRGISGDVFENTVAPNESTTSIRKGLVQGRDPVSSFDGSVF